MTRNLGTGPGVHLVDECDAPICKEQLARELAACAGGTHRPIVTGNSNPAPQCACERRLRRLGLTRAVRPCGCWSERSTDGAQVAAGWCDTHSAPAVP